MPPLTISDIFSLPGIPLKGFVREVKSYTPPKENGKEQQTYWNVMLDCGKGGVAKISLPEGYNRSDLVPMVPMEILVTITNNAKGQKITAIQ